MIPKCQLLPHFRELPTLPVSFQTNVNWNLYRSTFPNEHWFSYTISGIILLCLQINGTDSQPSDFYCVHTFSPGKRWILRGNSVDDSFARVTGSTNDWSERRMATWGWSTKRLWIESHYKSSLNIVVNDGILPNWGKAKLVFFLLFWSLNPTILACVRKLIHYIRIFAFIAVAFSSNISADFCPSDDAEYWVKIAGIGKECIAWVQRRWRGVCGLDYFSDAYRCSHRILGLWAE